MGMSNTRPESLKFSFFNKNSEERIIFIRGIRNAPQITKKKPACVYIPGSCLMIEFLN